MKYLNSRDNYLKSLNERRIIQQEKMLEDLTTKLILEENAPGSGAFGNNVKWGDSLLGRFINFVIRKIGVGIDMGRISLVSKQMKIQFDRLIADSAIASLSTEDKENVSKVQMSAILGVLKKAVEDNEKVGKIRDITEQTISNLKELEISEESKDDRDFLVEELEKFLEFLKKFKDSEGEGGPLSEDAEKTEDDEESEGKEGEEDSSSGKVTINTSYPTMIKNLRALSLVLQNYKKFKPNAIATAPEDYFYITKGGETIEVIQKDVKINKNKLTIDQIWSSNTKVLEPYTQKAENSKTDKNKLQLSKNIKIKLSPVVVKESYIYEAGPIAGSNKVGSETPVGSGSGTQRNAGSDKETHATEAYNKLKAACQSLENQSDKGVAITFDFLKSIIDNSTNEDSKVVIKSLYKEILRYLIGDKKATLNAPSDSLFKESMDIIKDKNKKIVVAEKIARFSMRAMQFDGKNLYGELGDLGKPLKEFVETIKELKKMDPSELKEEKEAKKESTLLRYDRFLLIREAEGDKPEGQEDKESQDEGDDKGNKAAEISKEIKEYFDENLDFDAYLLSEEESKEIEEKVEEASKSAGKGIVITGMNPIIEIVRLFNRAYKLHTTDVIPGARSGGAVDRLTYNEYTAFGGGSGEPSATEHGPYRHKKTFNIWEDAVMDVLADTRYAPVFVKETKIDDGAGNVREGAGVALRRLMLDLLDGDNLYKSGGSGSSEGAQKKALNEYFGEVSEGFFEKETGVKLGMKDKKTGKTDDVIVAETSDKISTSEMQFTKTSVLTKDNVITEGKYVWTLMQLNGKDGEGKPTRWYMFINEKANDKYYVMLSKTTFHFRQIIQTENPSIDIKQGDSPVPLENRERLGSGPYPIIHTILTRKVIDNLATGKVSNYEIRGLVKVENKTETKTEKLNISSINWLVAKEMEDGKLKGQNILKLSDKDKIFNVLKTIKPAFPNYREIVDKKYGDDNKFSAGFEVK